MSGTTADHSHGDRLDLTAAAGAVGRGRDFAEQILLRLGWLPTGEPTARRTADDVLLLVSELVTNACRHGAAPYRLLLRATGDGLRIEMTDAGSHLPVVGPDQPAVPGGFGMRLIAALADTWGVIEHPHGKTVWLEVTR
ncbi:ATP-binding protein [Streptacidiphilus sp. N1-12]|uniref:ATP-binding protein n=2 Tax=Streptacidiphilus alkalitolerans TaxID=3342712 RepID=A0ABV6V4H4_9ACTN